VKRRKWNKVSVKMVVCTRMEGEGGCAIVGVSESWGKE